MIRKYRKVACKYGTGIIVGYEHYYNKYRYFVKISEWINPDQAESWKRYDYTLGFDPEEVTEIKDDKNQLKLNFNSLKTKTT